MNKIYFLIITLSFTMLLGESKYKEPEFTLVSKDSNIEIREYSKYVVAKTSRSVNDEKNEKNEENDEKKEENDEKKLPAKPVKPMRPVAPVAKPKPVP